MIRVYCDWNVMRYMMSPRNEDDASFANLLLQNEKIFFSPYSIAHINDLGKGNSSDKNISTFVVKDLNFLNYISSGYMLQESEGIIVPKMGDAIIHIDYIKSINESLIKNSEGIINDLNILSEEESGFDFGNQFKSMLENQKSILSNEKMDNNFIKKVFSNYNKENYTKWDEFKDVLSFVNNLINNRDFIKEYKKDIDQFTGIKEEINLKKGKEVFLFIEDCLKKWGYEDTLHGLITSMVSKDKKPISNDEYIHYHLLVLDLFGYASDKYEKKTSNFNNTLNDATHNAYGTFCHYFIVEDKKFNLKLKSIYEYLGFETEVLTIQEFISKRPIDNIIYPKNENDLNETISLLMRDYHCEIQKDSNGVVHKKCKMNKFIFGYFDMIIEVEESNMVYLRSSFEINRGCSIYLEIVNLLEVLYSCFDLPISGLPLSYYIKSFVYNNTETSINWHFEKLSVLFSSYKNTGYHTLAIYKV